MSISLRGQRLTVKEREATSSSVDLEGCVGRDTYGVCLPGQEGSRFSYLTGVEVKDAASLPAGMSSVRIAAHRYAIFSHKGHVSTICKTLDAIWKAWLPNSSHEAARAPFFERYTETFDPTTMTGGVEIWIPLKV